MKKLVGVWLDSKKAVLISLINDRKQVVTIESDIESRERYSGESKRFGRFGQQYLNPEKHRKNKLREQLKVYTRRLQQALKPYDQIVLFGPSEMKNKLYREMQKNASDAERITGVESADHMSENQLVAWVRDYFARKGELV